MSAQQSYTQSESEEFIPQWAKKVIWYQVFPERFRNGDPTNDPSIHDIEGADPQEPPKSWQVHPWGSDWYKLQPYELENSEPELWKHLLRRRYGGDLQGIIDKLDYLKDLGITALYLNPVFDSPSLHKYDGSSYHHIDPNLGPDPKGDRKLIATEDPLDPATWVWTKADELALTLIEEVHKRGMRIIFDGVFNHMGIRSFAFQDVEKYQEKSRYRDWFTIHSFEDKEKGIPFKYEGWFGVASLPELREDENGIVSGPREYIFHATSRWMNPKGKGSEYGIDGWRLDVAFCIKHAFWKDWRKHVKALNPNAYLTAEIIDVPENVIPYLSGDEFDGEMNYNFAFTCAEFFFDPPESAIPPSEFDKKLDSLRNLYPNGVSYVVQNLFGSHDANRIGSHIVNAGIGKYRNWASYFGLSQAAGNPKYNVRKPNEDEIRLQKLFAIMQMTYIGAPLIYYGDEAGMWGANDPDCRKPMVWDDLEYEDEVTNPDQSKRSPDKVEISTDLMMHYRLLIRIRNQHSALQTGSYTTVLSDDKNNTFGFQRSDDKETIIVLLNNSRSEQPLKPGIHGEYTDLLTGMNYALDYTSEIILPSKWGAVLLQKTN